MKYLTCTAVCLRQRQSWQKPSWTGKTVILLWFTVIRPWNSVIDMSRNVQKRAFSYVRPTKTQISLRMRAVWSESSLSASFVNQNASSEDSDQTARMRRLIWINAGRTCPKVRFLTFRLNYLSALCLANSFCLFNGKCFVLRESRRYEWRSL